MPFSCAMSGTTPTYAVGARERLHPVPRDTAAPRSWQAQAHPGASVAAAFAADRVRPPLETNPAA